MKGKCKSCNTEFNFKVKDLILVNKELSNWNVYLINCPFCLISVRILYNPRSLKYLEVFG